MFELILLKLEQRKKFLFFLIFAFLNFINFYKSYYWYNKKIYSPGKELNICRSIVKVNSCYIYIWKGVNILTD